MALELCSLARPDFGNGQGNFIKLLRHLTPLPHWVARINQHFPFDAPLPFGEDLFPQGQVIGDQIGAGRFWGQQRLWAIKGAPAHEVLEDAQEALAHDKIGMLPIALKFLVLGFKFGRAASSRQTARLDDPIFGPAIAASLDLAGLGRLVGAAGLAGAGHNARIGTETTHGAPGGGISQFGEYPRS